MGGIGAGMICLEGTGALSHVSLRNKPDVFNEPCVFAAICGQRQTPGGARAGRARCRAGSSSARPAPATAPAARPTACRVSPGHLPDAHFPFAVIDADRSAGPAAGRDHRLEPVRARRRGQLQPAGRGAGIPVHQPPQATRRGGVLLQRQELHGARQAIGQAVRPHRGRVHPLGRQARRTSPWEDAAFSATVSEPGAKVNHAWFRGGWWDPLTMAWKDVAEARATTGRRVDRRRPRPRGDAFRALSACARAHRRPSCCAWRGSSGRPTCASARTSADTSSAEPTSRQLPALVRGAVQRTSTA